MVLPERLDPQDLKEQPDQRWLQEINIQPALLSFRPLVLLELRFKDVVVAEAAEAVAVRMVAVLAVAAELVVRPCGVTPKLMLFPAGRTTLTSEQAEQAKLEVVLELMEITERPEAILL